MNCFRTDIKAAMLCPERKQAQAHSIQMEFFYIKLLAISLAIPAADDGTVRHTAATASFCLA
ncbi:MULTISPECIES: hypothetical protein [Aquitalea]|uniref:hypothetical protein n=1 Tax=Aquitalea TaxID=407217 RepID=UPI00135758F1|nr:MULTISPECIES: hypothetical protein [Aquitalea]